MLINLRDHTKILVHQKLEIAELFGFETRNKYEILDENHLPLAFAAEQQKGVLGFIFRHYLGHWRKFEILFFTREREIFMRARHPFRWFFQRLEVYDEKELYLGAIQQRFSIFSKRFDVEDSEGKLLSEVSSPLWRIWTFEFKERDRSVAVVTKKWSGLLNESFTDKDKFLLEYRKPNLDPTHRALILASAIFIDLQYFEEKASGKN